MKAGLLWVSHAKDVGYFDISAKSYSRFARGWDFAKCVVPNTDLELFKPICDTHGVHLCGFDQHPTKGMLHHELLECYGDEQFGNQADLIFHIDSDTFFCDHVTPECWMQGDKPIISFMDFSHMLTTPLQRDEMMTFMGFTGRTMDFFRGQYAWKFCADFALGIDTIRSTMISWPIIHIKEVYKATREIIARRHGMSFDDYVFSCRNEFPQTFAEYDTLGAVAHRFFESRYCWRDITAQGHLPVRMLGVWSHGGWDRPADFAQEYGGRQTPRELYQRFGFI